MEFMQDIFKGYLLVSDIDGTLVDRHKQIPPRNREAIARFMAQGGVFSIATGRCDRSAQRIIDQVHPNGAAVTLNGAALYDSQKKQVIHDECLPDNYPQLVQKVFSRLPEIGIQLFCGSSITSVRESGITRRLLRIEGLQDHPGRVDDLPARVNKILFGAPAEQLTVFPDFFAEAELTGMYGMFTEDCYFEILPAGVTKGSGVRTLAQLQGIPLEHTAAVGDYYNDVEMLKAAGIPILSGNAPADIHAYAEYMACDCDEGVVADAIAYLERKITAAV